MPDSFTFSLSPLDTEALLPQLSAALEKRVELHSRQRLPGLWRVTDKLSKSERVSQSVANHRKRLRQVFGLLLWVLGLLMLAPGLIDPQELFVPLLAGACAFFLGQLTLWLYQRALLAILDVLGFQVVADDVAAESRQYRTDTDPSLPPLEGLCDKFARMDHCSVLYDVDKKRAELVIETAKERSAKGVILALTKFCDPEEFDYPILKKACDRAGLPLTLIEVDRQMVNYEQARTSLEAFRDVLL